MMKLEWKTEKNSKKKTKKKKKFKISEISVENRQKNNPKNVFDLLECRVLQNSPRRHYSPQWYDFLKEQTLKRNERKKKHPSSSNGGKQRYGEEDFSSYLPASP